MQVSPYASLTEYISEDDQACLTKSMESTPPFTKELARQLKSGEWEALIPHCDRATFPIQALQLLHEGEITAMQFSTSQLFFNVYPHHKNVRFIPLFMNDKHNPLASSMINETMKVAFTALIAYRTSLGDELSKNLIIPIDKGNKNWTRQQELNFVLRLWKQYPPSEHSFMLVPDQFPSGEWRAGDRLAFNLGFNILTRLSEENAPMRMIPSRGMTQAFIEATTVDAPIPIYRFGLSPAKGMHAALRINCRDIYQSFAPLEHLSPTTVDRHIANPAYAEAELHDFYHQFIFAFVPPSHRKIFTDFADAIQAYIDAQPSGCSIAEKFLEVLVDMEHTKYFDNQKSFEHKEIISKNIDPRRFAPELVFWLSIGYCYGRALEESGLEIDNTTPELIRMMAQWLIDHHEILSAHCKPVADLLISGKQMTIADYKLNFYYEIRTEVQNKLREMILELMKDDCEELTKTNAYFNTAPATFVRDHQYHLLKSAQAI